MQTLSTILTFLFIIASITTPIIVYYTLNSYKGLLQKKEVKTKIGQFYEGVIIKEKNI